MPLKEFWHGDMRLFSAYQKAYMRDTSYKAWLQGQYNNCAFSVVMANAFAKKGANPVEYPKWEDPMKKFEQEIVPNKLVDKEDNFRKEQANQNAWLHNLINKQE